MPGFDSYKQMLEMFKKLDDEKLLKLLAKKLGMQYETLKNVVDFFKKLFDDISAKLPLLEQTKANDERLNAVKQFQNTMQTALKEVDINEKLKEQSAINNDLFVQEQAQLAQAQTQIDRLEAFNNDKDNENVLAQDPTIRNTFTAVTDHKAKLEEEMQAAQNLEAEAKKIDAAIAEEKLASAQAEAANLSNIQEGLNASNDKLLTEKFISATDAAGADKTQTQITQELETVKNNLTQAKENDDIGTQLIKEHNAITQEFNQSMADNNSQIETLAKLDNLSDTKGLNNLEASLMQPTLMRQSVSEKLLDLQLRADEIVDTSKRLDAGALEKQKAEHNNAAKELAITNAQLKNDPNNAALKNKAEQLELKVKTLDKDIKHLEKHDTADRAKNTADAKNVSKQIDGFNAKNQAPLNNLTARSQNTSKLLDDKQKNLQQQKKLNEQRAKTLEEGKETLEDGAKLVEQKLKAPKPEDKARKDREEKERLEADTEQAQAKNKASTPKNTPSPSGPAA